MLRAHRAVSFDDAWAVHRLQASYTVVATFLAYMPSYAASDGVALGDALLARSDADIVLIGTPIDLRRLIEFDKPALRVTYSLQEIGEPTLEDVLAEKGLLEPALV